jgi:hypothetical protein
MWGSVQTVRGCAKHCSFCSVWRTDGQRPRQRPSDPVIEEIVALRRRGFRFIALADDNFYPVSLTDIARAERTSGSAVFLGKSHSAMMECVGPEPVRKVSRASADNRSLRPFGT